MTKYYFAGASRVAMRKYVMPQSPTVNYMLYDHLGSTNITTDTNGAVVTGLRYRAWGEVRYPTNGTNPGPSKYTYTGQYSNVDDFGLMFYNARWYDSTIGRFTQPDTIIPQQQGVQAWDRYAYTNNNPLRFTDPSGHGTNDEDEEDCSEGTLCYFENMSWEERHDWLKNFKDVNDLGGWFDDMLAAIEFMMANPDLSPVGGTAEVMDAAVLQAVNDGWLIKSGETPFGGGGQGWADFFKERENPVFGEDHLIATRLNAEQQGVDYAWNLPSTQSAFQNSNLHDQGFFLLFKFGADGYRSLAQKIRSDPLTVQQAKDNGFKPVLATTDPRTSGPYLTAAGWGGWGAYESAWQGAWHGPQGITFCPTGLCP